MSNIKQLIQVFILSFVFLNFMYSQNQTMILSEDEHGGALNGNWTGGNSPSFPEAHESMIFRTNENVVINNLKFCGIAIIDLNGIGTPIVNAKIMEAEMISGVYQPKTDGEVYADLGPLANNGGDNTVVYSWTNLNAVIPSEKPFVVALFIEPSAEQTNFVITFDNMDWICVDGDQTMCGYDENSPIQLGINPLYAGATLRKSESWNHSDGQVNAYAQHFGCFEMNYDVLSDLCAAPDFIKITPEMLNSSSATINMSRTNFDISSDLGLPNGSVLVTCSSVDVIDNNGELSFSLRGNADQHAYWTVKYSNSRFLKTQHGGALKGNSYDRFTSADTKPYTFTSSLQSGLSHSVSSSNYTVTNNTSTKIFNAPFIWESNDAATQFDFEFHTTATSNTNGGSGYSVYVDICGNAVNNPPVITSSGGAVSISISIDEGTSEVTDIDSYDDEDGIETNLTYTLVGVDSDLFTIDGNGNISFITAPDYNNPTDDGGNNVYDIIVIVTDSDGEIDVQSIAITVEETVIVNTTQAINDFNNTYQNTAVSGNVLTNDEDEQSDTQTANTTPVVAPTNGTVVLNSDGAYIYTPNAGYVGTDSFEYEICDNGTPVACDTATVTIEVIEVPNPNTNNAPVANDDTATTEIDTSTTGDLLSNDIDSNGDALTVNTTPVSNPTNGTVVINPDGTFTYTPNSGFEGIDTFEYEVCDDGVPSKCDTAIVTVEVLPTDNGENDTYANDDAVNGNQDTTLTGNVLDNDTDPEGDTQTVNTTPVVATTNGTITLNPDGTFSYVPNDGFTGNDSFVYEVCDDNVNSACDTATVYITVNNLFPDFYPTVIVTNSVVTGQFGLVDLVVYVGEINNVNSDGSPVELRIIKTNAVAISYDSNLTTFNGFSVENNNWTFDDTNPTFYKFTYIGNNTNGIFIGSTASSLGINLTVFSPVSSFGILPLKVSVKYYSGGEINNENNNDFEYIDYNNQ